MNPYIWREIHPVGQGALYSESFHMNNEWSPDFVALYDCGSFNKTRLFMEIEGLPQRLIASSYRIFISIISMELNDL